MSIKASQAGGPEIKTAVVHDTIAASDTTDSAHAIEASEDRFIRSILIGIALPSGSTAGAATVEASFSSQPMLNSGGGRSTPLTDETGAGVLAFDNTRIDSTNGHFGGAQPVYVEFDEYEPDWEENEELNLHVRNTMGNAVRYRVVIHYVRVSDC